MIETAITADVQSTPALISPVVSTLALCVMLLCALYHCSNSSQYGGAGDTYGELDDVWDDIADKMLAYSTEVRALYESIRERSDADILLQLLHALTC